MNFTNKSTDTDKLMSIIMEMRGDLSREDADALRRSAAKLIGEGHPQFVTDSLAPFLFKEPSAEREITSDEALSIIGYLVAMDPSSYLKSASRSIKHEAIRLSRSEENMFVSQNLLNVIVEQISKEDVEASSNSSEAIAACCKKLGLPFAESAMQSIIQTWRNALEQIESNKSKASTLAVRCATTVAMLMSMNDSLMNLAETTGATDLVLSMVEYESDPLTQISALDIIESLSKEAAGNHQLERWLLSTNILEPLLRMAGGEQNGSPDPLLGGPALRVLASLCKLGHYTSMLFGTNDTNLLNGFHQALRNFKSSGEVDRLAIIDAISSFASASSDALELVLNDPVTTNGWLNLSVAKPKLKSAILHSVAMVLDPTIGNDSNNAISNRVSVPSNSIGLKLYTTIGRTNGEESTDLMLAMAKSPLPEIRIGVYVLLKAVSKLQTGAQVLLSHPHFLEFLLKRDGESTKEGKEAKYAVVKAIFESEVKGLLDDDIVRKLEEYLKQGPFYIKAQPWDIAVE